MTIGGLGGLIAASVSEVFVMVCVYMFATVCAYVSNSMCNMLPLTKLF